MNAIILISIVLSLVAQIIGFRAYFDNSNPRLWLFKTAQEKEFRAYFDSFNSYSPLIQKRMILLPPAIFSGLAMGLIVILALLGWGSDDTILPIFGSREQIPAFIAGYLFFGALINLASSAVFFVVVQYLLPPQQGEACANNNVNAKLVT